MAAVQVKHIQGFFCANVVGFLKIIPMGVQAGILLTSMDGSPPQITPVAAARITALPWP
jgi:hypothetical protein